MNDQRTGQQNIESFWNDLKRFVGNLLEQWRAILVACLICAILVPILKYAVDAMKYKSSMQALQQGEENLEEEAFTIEEGVVKALTLYSQWQQKKEYFDKWYEMDIDGATENRAVLLYRIEAKDNDTDAVGIANIYTTMATDQALQTSLAKVYGVAEEDAKYIKDLYYFTLQSGGDALEPQRVAYLTFTAALPSKVKAEEIEGAVTDYLESQKGQIQKLGDKYEVEYISSTMTTLNNQTRISNQMATYKEVTTAETAFTTQYKLLKAREKELVDEIIRSGNVFDSLRLLRSDNLDDLAAGSETLQSLSGDGSGEGSGISSGKLLMQSLGVTPPSFSALFAIVGLLAGFVLYAAAYTLHPLLVRRVRDADEMRSSTGLRTLGEIYSYPYTTGAQRFRHDKKIYGLLHRGASDPAAELEKAAEKIAGRVRHAGADAVTMITLGKPSEWAAARLEEQAARMREHAGIRADLLQAEEGIASIEEKEFSEMSSAVLIFLSNTTKPGMAQDLLTGLKEYEIPVVGTEFLEGA